MYRFFSDATILQQNKTEADIFHKVCNTLSEYGSPQCASGMEQSFYAEHYEALISEQALQHLSGETRNANELS